MQGQTCCFIGHRKIEDGANLSGRTGELLLRLIETGTVNFIFGDHSAFNDLCYEAVTTCKEKHPEIKRIHFRCDYEDANDYTMQFLLAGYEESICPKGVGRAGRAGYAKRNQAMIEESDICVFYYDKTYTPSRQIPGESDFVGKLPKSGTAIAYAYAVQKKKRIYNLYQKDCLK